MRLQNIKLLTGMALMVAVGAIAPTGVMAAEMSDRVQTDPAVMSSDSNYYVGEIKSMVGDIITLELTNGDTKEIGLNHLERGRLGLVPGKRIAVRMVDGRRMVSLAPAVEAVTVARVTRVEETVTQVERTPRRLELPPAQERPAPVRQVPVESAPVTIESVEQTEVQPLPRRPIRALW